jgi:hypothetical protein
LADDMHSGFRAAYFAVFGVPRIARILAGTGEIAREPLRRAADTGLLMYELIDAGCDAPRGQEVLRRLRRMHAGKGIDPEDMRYVLTTFVVIPTRWIDRYGWRQCTAEEREAITTFYTEVGRRLGIVDPPGSYAEAAAMLDAYELAHVRYSVEGAALMAATEAVLAERLPRPLRPLAGRLTALYLTDALCEAVGVRPAGRALRASFKLAMRARGVLVRRRPARTEPRFTPGAAVTDLYPSGYRLDELGPRQR